MGKPWSDLKKLNIFINQLNLRFLICLELSLEYDILRVEYEVFDIFKVEPGIFIVEF